MIMESYGVPPKLIEMVKAIYNVNRFLVADGTSLTSWLGVKSGMKKGCNMLGFLFVLLIDWIKQRTVESTNTGMEIVWYGKCHYFFSLIITQNL